MEDNPSITTGGDGEPVDPIQEWASTTVAAKRMNRHKNRERQSRRVERCSPRFFMPRDPAREIAEMAARPASERSSYPESLLEFAAVESHQQVARSRHTGLLRRGDLGGRAPADMPPIERARRLLAAGIPLGELTRTDGSSVATKLRG